MTDNEYIIKIIEFIIDNKQNDKQFIVQQRIKQEFPELEIGQITNLFKQIIDTAPVNYNDKISGGRIGLKYTYGLEDFLEALKPKYQPNKEQQILHKKKDKLLTVWEYISNNGLISSIISGIILAVLVYIFS